MTDNQFTTVFMRLRASLRNRAMVILRSESDSDDALQDAFCRLWAHRRKIENEKHAAGMSYAAVRSVSIDKLRMKQAYMPEEVTDSVAGTAQTEYGDSIGTRYHQIESILKRCLSDRDYEILRKREMYGYGYDELAEEYGISTEAVRAVVSRGRRAIRAEYAGTNKKKH